MKKIILIITFAFIVFACRQQHDNLIESEKQDIISSLRADFERQTGYDQSKEHLLTPAFRTKINWKRTVQIHKDTILIAVTVLDSVQFPINGKQVNLKNRVILKAARNSDSKWYYSTVTFIPTSHTNGYSGLILSRGLPYNIEKIRYYSNGSIITNQSIIQKRLSNTLDKNLATSSQTLRSSCKYGYVNGILNTIICDNNNGGARGSDGGYHFPEGNPSNEDQMPVIEDGSPEAVEQFFVTNHCENPCLKNIVDAIIMSNIQSMAKESLMDAFKLNQDFNLDFYESTQLSNLTGGTATLTRYDKRPDGTFANMDVRIDLNLNTLPNASQEYVALVTVHEAIHAYLYTKGFFNQYGQQTVAQHDMMWSSYINVMAGYLNTYYGMNINEAKVLATEGLQNTFQSKIEDAVYLNLKNSTNYPSAQRAAIAQAYRTGTKGVKCK